MALTIPPYTGQGWTDNSTPDLSAETLNAVDAGITANSNAINAIANAVVSQIVNDPNKIASMAALYAINSNLIKYAALSGTVTVVSDANYASGYGAMKPMSEFTGYPSGVTTIIGYMHKTAYHNSKKGVSVRIDSNVSVHGSDAGDYIVQGVLLYQ